WSTWDRQNSKTTETNRFHTENKILSNDPNSFGRYLKKSLFKYPNGVTPLLGKKEKDDFNLLFRRNKWLTRNGKKHILLDL
ncbi:hypothetical protein H5410_036426, partial [Solanum commersonii]